MMEMFSPVEQFHYGGDEVNSKRVNKSAILQQRLLFQVHLNCWNTSREIVNWMQTNEISRTEKDFYEQWSIFQEKSRKLVTKANGGKEIPGIYSFAKK